MFGTKDFKARLWYDYGSLFFDPSKWNLSRWIFIILTFLKGLYEMKEE